MVEKYTSYKDERGIEHLGERITYFTARPHEYAERNLMGPKRKLGSSFYHNVSGKPFFYTISELKAVADCYQSIYGGIEYSVKKNQKSYKSILITNAFSIAEYKADFDIALCHIGTGKWAEKYIRQTESRFCKRCEYGWSFCEGTELVCVNCGDRLDNYKSDFRPEDFKHFGNLQKTVIADIYDFNNTEVFKEMQIETDENIVPLLRNWAYQNMKNYLNGDT